MAKTSPYETGELSDAMMLVLSRVSKHPVHGYRVMRDLAARSEGAVEIGPATMYRVLKGMRDAGWIAEIGGDGSRVMYQATDAGMQVLEKDLQRRKLMIRIATENLDRKEGKRE